MADNNAFGSWRSTWVQYGPIVLAAAQILHPLANDEDLHALVVESAAQGFVDTERIDPLDALLAQLIHDRSPFERTEVAKVLVANGIDALRAAAVTGSSATRIASPGREFNTEQATLQPPEFDAVRTRAADYETQSPDFSTDRLATGRDPASTSDEAADDGAIDQPSRKRWPMLVAGFGVVCVLAAGAIPVGRELLKTKPLAKGSVGFLIAANIPEPWELIDAKAFVSFPSIGPSVVAQRFTNADKTITIRLGTNSNDSRYSDPALGVKRPDPYPLEASRKDSKAEAMGGPGETEGQTKGKSLFKIWGEQKTFTFMQSFGLSAKEADSFANDLRPRTNLAKDGWASPDARFIERVFHPDVSAGSGYGSTLEFWLKSNHALRVIVSSTKAIDPQTLDFYWGPDQQTVKLASGRVLKRTQNNPSFGYQWTEGANSSFAQTGLLLDSIPPPPAGNQGTPQPFFGSPSTASDLAKAETLLDALKIGNAKLWREQLTQLRPINWAVEVQHSNLSTVTTDDLRAQKLGVLNRTFLEISPNQLQLVGSVVHGKAVGLCSKTICTRIYRDSEGSTDSADLLIDGHWWHFENLATNEDEPTFRTSPASTDSGDVTIYPTAEAALDKSYRWWGIDFGTDVQAARRNEQRELLLRPVQ
jgi:hypothetical protein